MNVVTAAQRYVSDERRHPLLHQAVNEEVRRVISLVQADGLSPQIPWSDEAFRERIAAYDQLLADLQRVEILTAFWGKERTRDTLRLAPARLCDHFNAANDGQPVWLTLRWYSVLSLVYAGGIVSVAAERYDHVCALLHTRFMGPASRSGKEEPLVVAATANMNDARALFKKLPGLERMRVPCSDHFARGDWTCDRRIAVSRLGL